MNNVKVKLAYTISLNEIPEKIVSLIKELKPEVEIKQHIDAIQSKVTDKDYIQLLEKIDNFRQFLITLDMRLEDCKSISQGFLAEIMKDKLELKEEEIQEQNNLNQDTL